MRCILLADGENLVFRYQAMKNEGRKPYDEVKHIPDVFVWKDGFHSLQRWQIIRANYYTSAVGGDDLISEIQSKIAAHWISATGLTGIQMSPQVFKRSSKSYKTSIADISIAVDALRHSYQNHVDVIFLLTGDGDFLPLIREIMRNGKQVYLGAFSVGLDKRLPTSVDRFINLDDTFFHSK